MGSRLPLSSLLRLRSSTLLNVLRAVQRLLVDRNLTRANNRPPQVNLHRQHATVGTHRRVQLRATHKELDPGEPE